MTPNSPLIALPGTLLDGRSLAAATAGLAARVELLGTCSSLDDELARLAALAQRPCWWLGHSLGGIVALQLAARQPQVVAGLLLLAANARAGTAAAARRAAQWETAQALGLRELAQRELAPSYGLKDDGMLVAALADQAEAVGMARFGHQLAYANERPSLAQRGPWIGVPVLVLSAAQDALCPPAQSAEIAALAAPGVAVSHHTLARAGHLFPMQRANWVAARLRGFIQRSAHDHRPGRTG